MKFNGTQTIPASRETVWKGLNDPAVLQQCIPGCSKIACASPHDMKATVTIKVGPVKANFSGHVTLSDLNAPASYRISGKGEGGFAGFATGGANVKLTAVSPTETQMDYEVDAQIGGKLAMLGSRLIDSTATSLANNFFTKFGNLMKAAGRADPAAQKVKAVAKTATKASTSKKPIKVAKKVAKSKPKK